MPMAALNYPGPFCGQIGILTDALISDVGTLPLLKGNELKKGVALELNEFRRSNNIPWERFYSWLKQLCTPADSLPPLHTIQVKINHLESKLKELKRNKRHNALSELNSEPFFESRHNGDMKNEQCPRIVAETKPATVSSFDVKVLNLDNHKLAVELAATKEALDSEQANTDKLADKLSVRDVNKKLQCRDDQIVSLNEQVKEENKIEDHLQNTEKVSKRLQASLYNTRKYCKAVDNECKVLSAHAQCLHAKIAGLQHELNDVGNERDCLLQRVEELESHMFETKEHKKKYLDNVRQCCIELLALNVGIRNVEPVIKCVLKHIVSIEVKELPQSMSLVRMFAEMKGLTCQQLAEELGKQEDLTLHSDGASKYEHCQHSFQQSLIGKIIRHKWCNEDGEEQWYTGHILSAVEGSTEWFNVQYDGEEDILTLNLYEDIANGDLDIVA